MKPNNVFLIIFILVVVAIIAFASYTINKQNKNKVNNENTTVNTVSNDNLSIVENLKMGITNFDSLNPLLTKNQDVINIDNLIFEPLINITSDYKTENCLAKEIKKIDDISYEIKIDSNIKWQDGSSFIAKDISFTIDQLKLGLSVYSDNVKNVESCEVKDSETCIIHLSSPVQFFEYNLSFPILSSTYYLNEDFINTSKIPIGTGMYKIASNDSSSIYLTINDRWRNLKTDMPKTQSITIKKYNAVGEIFNTFKLGNIDIVNTHMINYKDYVGTMGYNTKEYKERDYDFIALNCNDIYLSDVKIRRAISYAINKNTIVSTVFDNTKFAANTPLDYGSFFSTDENICNNDTDKAKKELEEDGWEFNNNRWEKKDGKITKRLAINLTVSSDNQDRINMANNIKNQLGNIGINVNIIQISTDKYYESLNSKNYQMILTGITNSVNPNLSYFYGENNLANYNNNDVKEKILNLDNIKEAIKISNGDCPYIGLIRNKGILILNANVGGDFSPNSYNIYRNFNKWFRQQ